MESVSAANTTTTWTNWLDGLGVPATVVSDPTAPSGAGEVQEISRSKSGGDYFSPVISVTGGQDYCVKAVLKWVGGGIPFVGIQPSGSNPVWVIGASYTDAYGPATEVGLVATGWQSLNKTIALPPGITEVRLVNELWDGVTKAGSSLAYFDTITKIAGACPATYLETFESGSGGWVDGSGVAATIVPDPDGLQGNVHSITRNGTGGDYLSPWTTVSATESTYCIEVKVKWVGGGTPFVGVETPGGTPVWVIGSAYTDLLGPTTVVDPSTTDWQTLKATVDLYPRTEIRLNTELYGGEAKAGSPLAYFDSMTVSHGACVSATVPYLETFESGAGGWADAGHTAATITADPDGLQGQVQEISRNVSGGDYYSPWMLVTAGQHYCVQGMVKWMGGGTPFIGVQLTENGSPAWVIGGAYTDVLGPTTEVNAGTTNWQTLSKSVVIPVGTTRIRLVNELYGGLAKAGSPLAYFDSLAVDTGDCAGPVEPPRTLPYVEDFEAGADGWADASDSAATLVADPDGIWGQVHVINRGGSGGDYHSPWIAATGGQTYCVQVNVKWMSGGSPFLGLDLNSAGSPVWIIGAPYTDAFGATTVVNSATTDWQTLSRAVTLPAEVTQIRLNDELWEGASKGGSSLAYFDGLSVTSGDCAGP